MNLVKEFPVLYGDSAKGKVKQYRVWVEENHATGTASIFREHGQKDGKKQLDEKVVSVGKNVGKSNETTPTEQALSEAESMWNKKKDNNYTESLEDAISGNKANMLPMLAQPFKDAKHRLVYPAYIQPKLNGVRCLAKRVGNNIEFTSRKGKSYNETLQHLVTPLLERMHDGQVFDGEIYIHGLSLQTIVSYVKKLRPESAQLQYWIYDIAEPQVNFSVRNNQYMAQCYPGNPFIIPVITHRIVEESEIKKYHDEFVQEGFEGAIVRNSAGKYEFDYRSYDLIKVKEFVDEEFTIIGGRTADTGRYQGCCVFLCETKEGKPFEVCPRGTVEIRKQYYQDLPKLIGKKLTVRFFNWSDDKIPLFPVAICLRDYEE